MVSLIPRRKKTESKNDWHAQSVQDVFSKLQSGVHGLSEEEAQTRLKRDGKNILPHEKPYSKVRLFFKQFNSPLIFILIAAAGISLYLHHFSDAIFIFIVLSINTSVGFYQENKANASLAALRGLVKVSARVLRGGNFKEVDSSVLVPGDVITLRPGDKIPADARLFEQKDLKVDESSLTGEWVAVSKSTDAVGKESVLAEQSGMVFMGSLVENGTGMAVVVETGTRTAIGAIVSLLRKTQERKTPLQEKILSLSRMLSVFILAIIGLVMLLGFIREESFVDVFVASLALAVSAIPAGLLPAITVILTLGMRRILKQNGLVRKLIATETLGSVTVICTDKTGTLTEGKMEVSQILTGARVLETADYEQVAATANGLEAHILALKAAVLSNDAFIENPDDELHDWVIRGRATERALLVAGTHAGLSKKKLEEEYRPLAKLPFASETKYSASLHETEDGKKVLYVLGAPEILAQHSKDLYVEGKKEQLDSEIYTELSDKLHALTEKGLRVVACAYREVPKDLPIPDSLTELMDDSLTLLGYIALKDPLRADAKDSIETTHRAGIRTILITGDHRLTALSIATEVGMHAAENKILEGKDLEALSDEELLEKVGTINIYARVSPHHKLRIVQALQKKGEVVAMIGDGVNDAPALKAADVGVSVGSGTDVAKEVADIVLLDDNFKTIVKAIEQGRVIFQNIRKVFIYLVADDFSEMFLFLGAMALGLPLPLLAAQILWVNLVEDGLPDIALTTEQETEGVMSDPPRRPDEPILNRPIMNWLIAILFITGIAAFATFLFLFNFLGDLDRTRSVVFALVGFDSLVFAYCTRSFYKSIFRKDIFANRLLVGATIVGFVLLLAAFYFPPLQYVLATVPLSLGDWALVVAITVVETILIEISKRKIFGTRSTSHTKTHHHGAVRPA